MYKALLTAYVRRNKWGILWALALIAMEAFSYSSMPPRHAHYSFIISLYVNLFAFLAARFEMDSGSLRILLLLPLSRKKLARCLFIQQVVLAPAFILAVHGVAAAATGSFRLLSILPQLSALLLAFNVAAFLLVQFLTRTFPWSGASWSSMALIIMAVVVPTNIRPMVFGNLMQHPMLLPVALAATIAVWLCSERMLESDVVHYRASAHRPVAQPPFTFLMSETRRSPIVRPFVAGILCVSVARFAMELWLAAGTPARVCAGFLAFTAFMLLTTQIGPLHIAAMRAVRTLPWSTRQMMIAWAMRPLAVGVGVAVATGVLFPGLGVLAALGGGLTVWMAGLIVPPMALILGPGGYGGVMGIFIAMPVSLIAGAVAAGRPAGMLAVLPHMRHLPAAAVVAAIVAQSVLYFALERSSRIYGGMRKFGILGGDVMG